MSWEGSGLRIALAVDSNIYLANIRQDYKWAYFSGTLVYAYSKPDRNEYCVAFWDTKTGEKYTKYVKKLISIVAHGDYCVLSTHGDEADQYILILCNAIGSRVDSRHIDMEPKFTAITSTHVVAASPSMVYVWQYRSAASKLKPLAMEAPPGLKKKDINERIFHVDDMAGAGSAQSRKNAAKIPPTTDPVVAVCASDKYVLVGRQSGTVFVYNMPQVYLQYKVNLQAQPKSMALNCNSTRLSTIDIQGMLALYDIAVRTKHKTTVLLE